MNLAREELQRLMQALHLEREEERNRYKELRLSVSIQDRKKTGVTWYPVIINSENIGLGGKILLEIEKTTKGKEPLLFQGGSMVSLFSNEDENKKEKPFLPGVVIWARNEKMKIAVDEEELPDWVFDGKLGLDLYYDERTFSEMERALNLVSEAENNRLSELRQILLGFGKPQVEDDKFFYAGVGLNESQSDAIEKVLAAKDVALIHGPPGTGKTTTLVRAIAATLEREKQVLVCAPSNLAVDLLTTKIAELGIPVLRLGHPARITEAVQKHSLDVKMDDHPDSKMLKQLRKDAQEARTRALKFRRNFGREEREMRKILLEDSKAMIRDAKQMENALLRHLLDETKVIVCTLAGTAGGFLKDKNFSTLFIDEAAQAVEPSCWLAILKAKRVIMAGDHCQLPPTVKSFDASEMGYSNTLFEKIMKRIPESSAMLNVQYRMNEKIMAFSNRRFYFDELKADESVAESKLVGEGEENWNKPVEFIDTAGCGFTEVYDEKTFGTSNPGEAEILFKVMHNLFQNLHSANHSPESKKQNPTIGIISPYKDQVNFLRELVEKDAEWELWKNFISIDTVDGFQGQERDIICISLVRSNDDGEIGFLKDTRRMNVAMTRARKKLIMIGDSATISNHPFFKSMVDYMEEIEAYKSAWEFMNL